MAAGIDSQCGISHTPPSSAQVVTNHTSLCSSYQVALNSHREGLNLSCMGSLPKMPRTNTPDGQLKTTTKYSPIRPTSGTHKGWSQHAPEPREANPTSYQLIHHEHSQSSQPDCMRVSTTHRHVNNNQQQESTQNPHKEHSWGNWHR